MPHISDAHEPGTIRQGLHNTHAMGLRRTAGRKSYRQKANFIEDHCRDQLVRRPRGPARGGTASLNSPGRGWYRRCGAPSLLRDITPRSIQGRCGGSSASERAVATAWMAPRMPNLPSKAETWLASMRVWNHLKRISDSTLGEALWNSLEFITAILPRQSRRCLSCGVPYLGSTLLISLTYI